MKFSHIIYPHGFQGHLSLCHKEAVKALSTLATVVTDFGDSQFVTEFGDSRRKRRQSLNSATTVPSAVWAGLKSFHNNITKGHTSHGKCETTLYKVKKKLPIVAAPLRFVA